MTGPGDWVIPANNVTAPTFAPPNDAAIILGPDLPPCMRTRYTSAQFFRPAGTVTAGLAGKSWWFVGEVLPSIATFNNIVEEGWLVYDNGTICGFVVYLQRVAPNVGGTGLVNPTVTFAALASAGASGFALTPMNWTFGGAGDGVTPTSVNIGTAGVDPNLSLFTIDGVTQGRGLVATVGSTVSTAATGAAEIVSLTSPAITWANNQAFEVKLVGQVLTSVANQAAFISLRRNNVAGTLYWITGTDAVFTTVADHYEASLIIRNTSGAAIVDNVVSTISRAAGAGTVTDFAGGANQPRYMKITNLGNASAYPYAPQI